MAGEIYIVGRDFLGNELLCHFLSEKLPAYRLQTLTQLDNFYHSISDAAVDTTLLLCDCKSYPPEYFLNRLQIYLLRHSCKSYSLFYNLPQDHELDIRLLKSGVQGIVHADAAPPVLLQEITRVLAGRCRISGRAGFRGLLGDEEQTQPEKLAQQLTPRECQILRMICHGSSNEMIAETLSVSRHTVKTHLYNIFRKISVDNRLQAAKWAERYLPSSW